MARAERRPVQPKTPRPRVSRKLAQQDGAQPRGDFHEDWQRYFDLYNFAPVTYVRLDRNGVVEEINRAGCVMLGNSASMILKRPLIVFVAPSSRTDFLDHMRRCRSEDRIIQTELALQARDGTVIPVRAFSKRSQAMGRAVYWTVLTDLTEQQRLDEARLDAESERARAKNEERLGRLANEATHRFLNVLSHELRTPLTPALFAASRLIESDMPARARHLAAVIKRNIQSEARLIDDLLDVSRIERGCLELALSTTDVHTVLQTAVEACRPLIGDKQLTLVIWTDAIRHHALGDPGRLRQVFCNLLTNAIKFTDGGTIEVHSTNGVSGSLRISVRDTGIGLDTAKLEGLFKSFEQHRGSSSRGGLGLGLAICRGVIEGHHGRIWAMSEGPGLGCTFEVELPTVSLSLPTEAERVSVRSSSPLPVRMRILIVEDDDDTAAILEDLLGQEGHTPNVVHTVSEARRQDGGVWDIVISDLGLPDGSGLDVARHFRGLTPRPRLIALSGYSAETDMSASTVAGFERHLVKPIDLAELRHALQS